VNMGRPIETSGAKVREPIGQQQTDRACCLYRTRRRAKKIQKHFKKHKKRFYLRGSRVIKCSAVKCMHVD